MNRSRNNRDDENDKDFKTGIMNLLNNFKENMNIMVREIEDKTTDKWNFRRQKLK